MQFTITTLMALATMAVASPVPEPQVQTQSRQQLIALWKDARFTGFKFSGSSNVGKCENLPGDFKNNVSSGKAERGFRCTIWDKANCDGRGFSFNTQGEDKFPDWINNKANSWKCVRA